jgi:phospholipid/cholesterol/gamma-HCH transport system ATP-binding protein
MAAIDKEPMIEITGLGVTLDENVILSGADLTIYRNEILAIVGGSGSGKTTFLRAILMLNHAEGSIKIDGKELLNGSYNDRNKIRHRWGVMFQHGALFSSLTVLENVAYPLQEFSGLDDKTIEEIAKLKIAMVGLESAAAYNYPEELSGGMLKRAAIARAIAMDPEILFLDEPTAGLDPHGASGIDDLILSLKQSLGLTVIMVTHDLDTIWHVSDRVAFLGDKKVLAVAPIEELMASKQAGIIEFFSDKRAQDRFTGRTGKQEENK